MSTEQAVVHAPAVPAPAAAGHRWRPRDPGRTAGWAAGAFTLGFLLLRNLHLFHVPVHEDGDVAANSLLVNQAERLHLLVGNYSRAEFHHPGPAFLYVAAAGQAFVHGLLHAVPTPWNGQLVGYMALNAVLTGLLVRVLHRQHGSLLVSANVLLVTLLWFAHHVPLTSSWFPNLYVLPFLLFVVSASVVAAGSTADLPVLVLSGALLVHGHVGFVLFVTVGAVAVLGALLLMRRRHPVTVPRRAKLWSVALAGLFALPLLLQLALHFPGDWMKYYRYARHEHSHTLHFAVDFLATYWPTPLPQRLAFAAAFLVAGVLAVLDPVRTRGRAVLGLLGGSLLATVVFLEYARRGVDLDRQYIGRFYLAVPLVVLLAAVVAVGGRLVDRADRRLLRVAWVPVLAATVVVAATGAGFHDHYPGDRRLPAMVAAARSALPASGPVPLWFPHNTWPHAAGFLLQANRSGLPVCVAEPYWVFMFSGRYTCSAAADRRARWQLWLAPTPRRGARVLWRDAALTLSETD